jgi:hypothetical protein
VLSVRVAANAVLALASNDRGLVILFLLPGIPPWQGSVDGIPDSGHEGDMTYQTTKEVRNYFF